jgi:hypothetical protein
LKLTERQHVSMLSDEVFGQLSTFHCRWSWVPARCLLWNDDHGPQGVNPSIIPYAPMSRSRLYTGTRETGSYNHQSQLVKFKGRYYFAFSNGLVDEANDGQRIAVCSSPDGCQWSDAATVISAEKGTGVVHNSVALLAAKDAMYLVDWREEAISDTKAVGMRRIVAEKDRLDILSSTDGLDWQCVGSLENGVKVIYEAPRLTADGRLLCVCGMASGQPAVLLWAGSDFLETPKIIPQPQPYGSVFWHGEGSWYQTDEGRIVMFWRDEGASCRVWVHWSDDGGETWTPPAVSDIPDSMSRMYAGRLTDGRYYLCNNAFPTLLDRRHLMLLLSDDGSTFNKVYILVDDPTSQRLKGLLKTDGYQYPCCVTDGDKLFIGYSVNKEDIECGIVDATHI